MKYRFSQNYQQEQRVLETGEVYGIIEAESLREAKRKAKALLKSGDTPRYLHIGSEIDWVMQGEEILDAGNCVLVGDLVVEENI